MALYTSDGTKVSDCNTDIVLPDPEILNQMRRDHEELKRMADSLEDEVKLAKEQAAEAKVNAARARRNSRISIFVSVGAFLVALATFVVKFFIPGF